jgi:glucosamine-6-phosphate deaminase
MEIVVVPADGFAAAAVDALRRAVAGRTRLCLGVPTGRTVVPFYARMSEEGFRFPEQTTAYALDEYCWADPSHPGTNASFFRTHWSVAAGAPLVVLPRSDATDPAQEMERHCEAISRSGGLDVALLGIGRNGHIGFNEPGCSRDSTCRAAPLAEPTRAQVLDVWPDPPTHGMTVGVRQIMSTRHVILLATGSEKASILRAALTEPPTSAVPASYLQDHPSLTVVCDEAAASLLPIA